jgi:RNA polymerase sigma-70 factor (ECF subfamily)
MSAEDPLQALVRRCQGSDSAAFEELFRRFQPRLRYYVRRLGTDGNHTDDTLQEVWAKVVRGIGALRDRGAFVAWLYTIARNEVYGKAKARDPFVELTDEHWESLTDDPEPAFREEDAARIHQALETLSPAHREILTLCFLEEFSHLEIAGILGLHPGTVKSRLYYAKQALRQELEREYGSP